MEALSNVARRPREQAGPQPPHVGGGTHRFVQAGPDPGPDLDGQADGLHRSLRCGGLAARSLRCGVLAGSGSGIGDDHGHRSADGLLTKNVDVC